MKKGILIIHNQFLLLIILRFPILRNDFILKLLILKFSLKNFAIVSSILRLFTLSFLLYIAYTTPILSNTPNTNHWEAILNNGATVNYWTSNDGEPSSNWRAINYNDAHWQHGTSGIGYGDNDDGTTIDLCNGIAIRYTFNIEDLNKLTEVYFYIDYDDAFIAYINGTEIARSNGLSANLPTLNTLSTSQHEAGSRQAFHLNYSQLTSLLLNGTNVLAIQVHNASANSSDLSSSTWLFTGLADASQYYEALPAWFEPPFSFTSSNLPIILINTENGQRIKDEPKTPAIMKIINNPTCENFVDDYPTDYDGHIGIEWRGNSTQGFPKKPYNLETRDSLGENLDVPLFGWHKENDWVLRASYLDHTFIRNCLANEMSRLNGWWAPRTKLVEVILNGKYQGIYVFMEDIKPDKGRVDIERMTIEDTNAPDVTGGYIWEITGFEYNLGSKRKLKFPKYEEAATEQIEYITNHDNAFRAAVKAIKDGNYEAIYSDWINVESFINEMLIQEAMRNSDAYSWSGYFHKDRNGKTNAGPVWDFDQSSGNSSFPDNAEVEGWLFEHPSKGSTPDFWPTFFKDDDFAYAMRHRWETLRQNVFSEEYLYGYIDSLAYLLRNAQKREFTTWPVLGANIWRETTGYENRDTYQKEVDYLKSYLHDRWQWMDKELSQYENPHPSTGLEEYHLTMACHIYPNPVEQTTRLYIDLPNVQSVHIEIINNLGSVVHQQSSQHNNTVHINLNEYLPQGLYYVKIDINNDKKIIKRILKITK